MERDGVRIERVELHRVALPLVEPFRAAHGTTAARDVLLVHVVGHDSGPDGGGRPVEGWGECVALDAPTYSPEDVAGALDALRRHLLPSASPVLAAGPVTAAAVRAATAWCKGHAMARAALEQAVLDAELRARGCSLAGALGATRDRVVAGVAVGLHPDLASLLATVERHLAEGYRRIKLKIRPGWDLIPARAVRALAGPSVLLQVDANGSYTLDDAATLEALDDLELALVEQPFPEDRLLDHAELARRIRTPVCLDESITSAAVARDALAAGACSVVCVKPGRLGGLAAAVEVHDVCRAAGAAAWCGGMLETGVGRAALVALAALPGFTLPGDLSASARYFATDLTAPFVLDDGAIAVPAGPGIGVAPLPEVLEAATTWREVAWRVGTT